MAATTAQTARSPFITVICGLQCLCLVGVPAGCAPAQAVPSAEVRDPAIDDQIAVLQSADVEVEVTAALRAHDLRWVGCAGVGIYVPGVTDEALIHSHGVRIIPNTTDGIDHASVRDLQPIADAYATAYNLALRRRLEERP